MSMDVPVGPGRLADGIVATRAVAAVDELLLLDDLWTARMTELRGAPRSVVESQLDDLAALVAAMDRALAETAQGLGGLRAVLESTTDGAIDEAIGALLRENEHGSDLYREIFSEIADAGPCTASIEACRFVLKETGNERELLGAKLQRLRDDGVADPDLRPIFRCALTLAAIGGFGVLSIVSHGVVGVVGVIAHDLVGDLLSWKASRCGDAWDAIRHR